MLHELGLYRFKDDETIKDLLLSEREEGTKRVVEVDSTMAEQNQSSYVFVKFKTGRYFASALPPGRLDQLRGARDRRRPIPHVAKGMAQQFRVTG